MTYPKERIGRAAKVAALVAAIDAYNELNGEDVHQRIDAAFVAG